MIKVQYNTEDEYIKLKNMINEDEFNEVSYEQISKKEVGKMDDFSVIFGAIIIFVWMLACAWVIYPF